MVVTMLCVPAAAATAVAAAVITAENDAAW